ncbi:MAG: site-2 protease family protein [Oscillospiraceae bacterium]|nr:site-2 protease family protein [Oscillospiraceae bacterium]
MTIVFAILLFSLLIFIHELGHFAAAKLSGVQVNEFAIFMGPAIFKKQVGETLYSIRCIPIGGYCAMEGEDEDSENPHAFGKAKWWKRLIILAAGAVMNFVAGLIIFAIIYLPGNQIVVPEISQFTECCIFNTADGLQLGDEILELDGERIYVNGDVTTILGLNDTIEHDITVLRNGEKLVFDNLVMAHTHTDENGESYLHYGFVIGAERTVGFGGKLDYVWKMSINTVRMVRMSLQMLFTGKAGVQDLTGPVGIVQIMSETADSAETTKDALLNMLYFGGFIAINLAVMNLLPFPALDGGRIVALLLTTSIEAITKKKINPKYEAYIHGAGMVLLLALMAFVLFKDIFVIFKG